MQPAQQRRAAGRILLALAQTGGALPRSNLAALSNIRAIRTTSGSAGYRIAAPIGSAPGIKLQGGGLGTPLITGHRRGLPGGRLRALPGTGLRGPRGGFRLAPVRRNPPDVHGCLSRARILAVVAREVGGVQACYERALVTGHHGGGKATFDWTIGLDGTVSDARLLRSSLRAAGVVRCILGRIRSWRFPRPGCGGSVKVRFPFIFREQGFR